MANARHPKAGRFVQQRTFSGLSGFAKLEHRIGDLPDETSRGDAFEVFAEAYLATLRRHDAEAVFPFASIPTELLAGLKLTTQDYGIDGVLKTRLGQLSPYQVKFRTGHCRILFKRAGKIVGKVSAGSPTQTKPIQS